jgi:hypothetical protein
VPVGPRWVRSFGGALVVVASPSLVRSVAGLVPASGPVVGFVGAGRAASLASASGVFSGLLRSCWAAGRLPVVAPAWGAPVRSWLGPAAVLSSPSVVAPGPFGSGFRPVLGARVRALASSRRVLVLRPGGAGFAARCVAVSSLVRACGSAGGGFSGSFLVCFAFSPCPLGLSPSLPVVGPWFLPLPVGLSPRSVPGWGWPAVARAVSLGVRVVVFVPPSVGLPAWSGGSWVPAAPGGLWGSGWRWRPAPLLGYSV